MSSWQTFDWTPALALRLADVLAKHGAGHLRQTAQLRASAARGTLGPVLATRAEHAYEAAAAELRGTEEYPAFVRAVGDVICAAQGLAPQRRERTDRSDWIQEAAIRRAESLGLTAYTIAAGTGGAVSEDHVRDYLTRRKSMGSHKLQHVLRVLGLDLLPRIAGGGGEAAK